MFACCARVKSITFYCSVLAYTTGCDFAMCSELFERWVRSENLWSESRISRILAKRKGTVGARVVDRMDREREVYVSKTCVISIFNIYLVFS